jgi:hypothetical protein
MEKRSTLFLGFETAAPTTAPSTTAATVEGRRFSAASAVKMIPGL